MLPKETTAQIRVQSPGQEVVFDQRVPLSALGTARAQFELPAKTALGYYNIEVSVGKGSASGTFFVEEYKKPEYKVTVTPERARVLQGEAIRATVEARYYFGEPVANAKVKYVVHTARAWSSWEDDEEGDFGGDSGNVGEEEGGYDYAGQQMSEQEGQLDANGRLVVTVPTRVGNKFDVTYRVEARVTDAANREIAGHGSVLATYGSFHVRVQPQSYVYSNRQAVQFTVEAQDYEQHPIATPVKLELRKHQYGQEDVVELAVDQRTGADGKAMFSVKPPRTGSFYVVVTAKTPEGRDVQGTSWIWIAGPGEQAWGETRQVEIVPDKKSYKVGDTARLLVVNGVAGAHMLLTSEAQTVLSTQVIDAKDTNATVEVPITELDQPNFYVSAVFMSQDQIYIGNKSLSVPAVEKRLKIEVQPSKAQFQPGEDASFTVRATDAAGQPVAAEFSLGVVDDALYAVRPDHSGDIVDAFYERRYYSTVTTENSLTFSFHGEAGKRALQLASSSPLAAGAVGYRARLAQVKPGSDLVMPKVRKAFPDTAFWTADAKTDASGRGVVHLAFPDSLTTWRTTVRAITADTRAGAAVNRVVVRKNVIVRIAAPRFFRVGDEVTVSAIVHNYLDTAKQARVSLDITGVDVLSGAAQTISLPSRADAKLDWRVRARSGAAVKLLAKALTNEESDAMEISLPVVPFGVRMTNALSGALDNGSKQVSLDFPAQSLSRTAEFSLTPSIAGAIFSALDYLTAYPYGCTEQTMSSFLPNVIVARAMQELQLKSNVDEGSLREKINAGLERLYDFQHEDGGWGWWKEDASMVFMTAYVVSGLSQASEARYEVRADAIAKGKEFLRAQLREHPRMIPDLQAYVVYALVQSGERDRGMLDAVWEKKDKLSPQGVAFAGLAAHAIGDGRAGDAARMLETAVKQEGETAYWPATYDNLLDIPTDDSAATTAYAMRLLTAVNPQNPLLPNAAVWLVQHRYGEYWETTKQTAMVIYGITDYVKSSHELQPNFTAEVLVNGKAVLTRKFTAADAMSRPATVEVPASALASANKVEIRTTGAGRVYWSARGQYFSTDKKLYQSGQLSLNVTRDYFRLQPVKTEEKMYYELEPLSGSLQIGDVLAVRVSVNGGRWKYLLVEDPIPAGAEFIQRDDLYDVHNKPGWWQYWWSRREFHDDRAAIFQTTFNGRSDYFYLLKIVNPGIFRVSPALVQPMYQPNVISTTDPATVEVK